MTLRGWLGLFVVMAVCGVTFVSWPRFESDAPVIAEQAPLSVGAAGAVVAIEVADEGSGLRSLEARLQHAGGTTTLAADSYRGTWMAGCKYWYGTSIWTNTKLDCCFYRQSILFRG